MARDEQRMFRIHDAPKPAITPADFQRLMLKKVKAQALARALHTARQRQAAAEQQTQPADQLEAQQTSADCQPDSERPSQAAAGRADSPQPMAIDGMATPGSKQSTDGALQGEEQEQSPSQRQQQQPADSGNLHQSAADDAEAKQQEAVHSAALRRQLIQSRKEALSRQRREAYEAEEARKQREYQRKVEEHEAAESARRRQAADAAAEAQRLAAEAAAKAAQAEELRLRFEALSAQKGELVQQLKQVLELEKSGRRPEEVRAEPQLPAAEVPTAAQPSSGAGSAHASALETDIDLPPHLAERVKAGGATPMAVDATPDDIDLPPHLLSHSRGRGAKGKPVPPMPPPPPLADPALWPK